MSLIIQGPEYVEQLNAMLRDNNTDWVHFERLTRGEITISGIKFYLRVGLHMNQPRKAIIAAQQFVRFAPFKGYLSASKKEFKLLDPKCPDDSLYYDGVSPHSAYWHPDCPKDAEARGVQHDWTILDHAPLYNRPRRI